MRVEGRQPIARNLKLDLAGLGQNRLLAIAVPAIGAAVFLAGVEMMVHLGVQRSFGKRLLQLVEQPVLRKCCLGISPGQKLIKHLVGKIAGCFVPYDVSFFAHRYGPHTKFPTVPAMEISLSRDQQRRWRRSISSSPTGATPKRRSGFWPRHCVAAATGKPRVINTDKNPAYGEAIAELKKEGLLPKDTQHRQGKYLNNRLEGDHRQAEAPDPTHTRLPGR